MLTFNPVIILSSAVKKIQQHDHHKALHYGMNGIGFPRKDTSPPKVHQGPKTKICTECSQEGHFAIDCKTPPPPKLPSHLRPNAFNAHYMVSKASNGRVYARFLGPKDKSRPKQIWIPKTLVASAFAPTITANALPSTSHPSKVWVVKSQA